ncbi:hypothetical protein SESBI_05292 [Sesbania bispinosa]|nr:hypothetical protein SESBI_05292 [Sesbania bispinosa]
MQDSSQTREEADQLARSTKKAKMEAGVSSSEDETVVMETYPLENNAATEVSKEATTIAEEEDEDDTSGEEASLDEENDAPIGDARCPVVKVSREERKNACLPWKN